MVDRVDDGAVLDEPSRDVPVPATVLAVAVDEQDHVLRLCGVIAAPLSPDDRSRVSLE